MNWMLIVAAVLSWLAVGAVISCVTDAYLREKRGSAAGFAMGTVFWPIAVALGALGFLGVGLWTLNKIAYEEALRIRARRNADYAQDSLRTFEDAHMTDNTPVAR